MITVTQIKEILDSNLGVFLGGIEGKDDAARDIIELIAALRAPAPRSHACLTCGGDGKVPTGYSNRPHDECPDCNGDGRGPAHDVALDTSPDERAEGFGAILKDEAKRLRARADDLDPPHSAASSEAPDEEDSLCDCEDCKRNGWAAPTTSPEPTSLQKTQTNQEPEFNPAEWEAAMERNADAVASPEPMTVDRIDAAFVKYLETLTIMDPKADHQSFAQGYVAGWNAKEAQGASPEPDAVREAIARIRGAVTGTDTARDYAGFDPMDDVKTLLAAYDAALSRPAHGGRQDIIEQCAKIADDHTPRKHEGTLAAHVAGSTIANAIRALARNHRVTSQPDTDGDAS